MLKTRKSKSNLLKLCVAFLFPFTLFGGLMTTQFAHADGENYAYYYQENVSVTNGDFTSGSVLSSGDNLSGWTVTDETSSSNATGMFVDTGTGSSTSDDESNATFSENQERYLLNENPGANLGDDSRILMINSKSNSNSTNVSASKGYYSDSISLEANSFYKFTIAVRTMTNGDSKPVSASIYVDGLTDSEGEEVKAGIEDITSQVWHEYFIYIATGASSQEVNIQLYLGGDDGVVSSGAVFFDSVSGVRLSENAFFEECYSSNAGYQGQDRLIASGEERCFVIDSLVDNSSLIDTSAGQNFDFEFKDVNDDANSLNTLGNYWSILEAHDGHAYIENIRDMQPTYFKNTYGYEYVGDDLTYNNKNAMILTTLGESGYVGVQSSEFEIKAHTVYKISFNIKVAGIESGSFYFKVQENDTIYSLYSDILTDDEEDTTKDYLALQDGQTSSISSNSENAPMNDYQTVEMYVKGHSLYDTSVNFQLWLGDSETSANGTVVIDNITVEYASDEEFSSASNSVEFTSFSSDPATIPNSYFNSTEADGSGSYPISATDWTSEIESEDYNTSGVVYLYDLAHYNENYLGKYDWAGIYPGQIRNDINGVVLPNNVYMMYNSVNSYQSLTSSTYTLDNDSYYKLSFNYYNENRGSLNASKIKVEVVDENGIVLFSQDNISSRDNWNTMNIFFHTAELVSHNIQVVIHFGEDDPDKKVGGIVYLDNFVVEESNETEFNAYTSIYKADLTNYFLNLTENGEVSSTITTTSAYDFSVEPIYDLADEEEFDFANGGIISGNNNPYGNEFVINDSNYLAIQTFLASRASLTSAYTISMDADGYYKLTFDLATIFGESALNASTDEHDCQYGVTITVDGFEPITEIVTGGDLKSYTIYFNASEAVTPTISFTLVSDCHETIGTALITHLDFNSVTESEYNNAVLSSNYGSTVFTSAQNATESDEDTDTDDDTDEDTSTDDTTEPEATSPWLLVSSLIFAVAIIIAIIGFALRHVKIKKIERIRQENYDRKLSKNHDVILVEAQKRRDEEVRQLQNAKKMFEEDKARLEEEHKAFVRENRLNSKGKISKEIEKSIKKYNNDIINLDEKISIISEKIDTVMSADYLLTIERRIVAEEDSQLKKDKREYKKELKRIKEMEKNYRKSESSQNNDEEK